MPSFNRYLDRWRHRILSYAGNTELRDHLIRSETSYVDFRLSASQMDTLNATVVSVLPAPGAGLANLIEDVAYWVSAGTTAFELGSGTLDLRYGTSAGALVSQLPNASVEAAAGTSAYYYDRPADVAPVLNSAIVASASTDVTAGSGAVMGRIYYRTIRFSELVNPSQNT